MCSPISKGPGTITRFWSANPSSRAVTRFYFDGETRPRFELPLAELFTGRTPPFDPVFSYISGTGGNLYFPLPYANSLKITIEEKDRTGRPLLRNRISHLRGRNRRRDVRSKSGRQLGGRANPNRTSAFTARNRLRRPATPNGSRYRLTIQPGETQSVPEVLGEKAVFQWSARGARYAREPEMGRSAACP